MALCVACDDSVAQVRIAYQSVGGPDADEVIIEDQCYTCASSVLCKMPSIWEPADEESMHPSIILVHKVNGYREAPEEDHPFKRRRTGSLILDQPCEACEQYQEAFCVSYLDAVEALPTSGVVHQKLFCYYCVAALMLKMHCGLALPDNHRNAFKDVRGACIWIN
jgi:hypothetical protein